MTSPAGTDLVCRFGTPPEIDKLDGLIAPGSWQNLPSGQIVIQPASAEGVFVADSNLGDWFEHDYRVADHPVRFEFEECRIRRIHCDNKKLERDLRLFLHSSANSGKISEVVIGTNLGLTQGHRSALFEGYRPGASITIGAFPSPTKHWTSATTVPVFGVKKSLFVGARRIMTDDVFSDDLLRDS
jgi:leucyl aminopeptidase (aminopeptidase T)